MCGGDAKSDWEPDQEDWRSNISCDVSGAEHRRETVAQTSLERLNFFGEGVKRRFGEAYDLSWDQIQGGWASHWVMVKWNLKVKVVGQTEASLGIRSPGAGAYCVTTMMEHFLYQSEHNIYNRQTDRSWILLQTDPEKKNIQKKG